MASDFDFKQVLSKDIHFLHQAYKNPQRYGGLEKVMQKYHASQKIFQKRLVHLPNIEFDHSLPVHEHIEQIKEAIENHQVIIVSGETGSGKTTQLPKICLELKRGIAGLIGHTQPRRIAARSVATRIAEEINTEIGQAVGYKVRFTDKTSPQAYIKLMTDGVLLAETQTDRFLTRYDTIIIDEAHERSLNIDFLIGYLKNILPKRPDLKVIITSATIDAKRFSEHFNDAPIINVSGRTYPVDILYRPCGNDADELEIEMPDAIANAVDELWQINRGDILVFLPGEREIHETASVLRKKYTAHAEILPLFSRLSQVEQQKIFHPQQNINRIILATNVAETSLTVPGIRFVIDTGLARVKRYSARAKVEQLYVEKISQAAAKQRAGRCGRVAEGVCIRLYAEDDFLARSEFTAPEITRSNLAAVILRMISLRLGNIESFPFLEVPDGRLIKDGLQVLFELGALDKENKLTSIGQAMAKLPIDPKISRILLAANEKQCVQELLIIASALSIQDPRERPFDAKALADKAHEKFSDKNSDFLSYLYLWEFFAKAKQEKKSNRQLFQLCQQNFLSYLRMREWRELHHQLQTILEEMGMSLSSLPKQEHLSAEKKNKREHLHYELIHRALLTGLVAQVGMKAVDSHEYTGARGIHFYLFPGSYIFKSKPKWVMSAELTDTTKLYARTVAKIEPHWVEQECPHLVKCHYFEPHWSQKRGEVMASERVTLYGLTVLPRRLISFGQVDSVLARELFIKGALVNQECELNVDFFKHNRKLIHSIAELEHKSRKQDVLVDDEVIYDFYQQRIPEEIVDLAGFKIWFKKQDLAKQQSLIMTKEDLMQHSAYQVTVAQFPTYLETSDGRFKLKYRFEPHHPLDGVSIIIPLTVLNRINTKQLEWLVPGMIREKIQYYIKSLPKQIRRICVPVSEFITEFLHSEPDGHQGLLPQLAHAIARQAGDIHILEQIDINKWQHSELPTHCFFNIQVIDDAGQELESGRDILQLQQKLGQVAVSTFRDNSHELEKENISNWNIGTLPKNIKFARGKQQLTGYLGLEYSKDKGIALRLFDTDKAMQLEHRQGVIELMKLQLKEQVKDLNKGLMDFTQITMLLKGLGNTEALKEDITQAVCDRAFIGEDDLPRSEAEFKEQIKRARSRLPAVKEGLNQYLLAVAKEYMTLNTMTQKHPLKQTLQQQLACLVYLGFVQKTPWRQWQRLPIYLKAMQLRIDKYSANAQRDMSKEHDLIQLQQDWQGKIETLQKNNQIPTVELLDYFWDIQELRVSLFAQELKTPYPVSVKRLQKKWSEINKVI